MAVPTEPVCRFVLFGKSDSSQTYEVWETLAKEQRELNPHLLFAFVDRYHSPQLCDRFHLVELPVFLLFRDQQVCYCMS